MEKADFNASDTKDHIQIETTFLNQSAVTDYLQRGRKA
jgi:hypothetical protein